MGILVSKTFEVWDEASLEIGETDNRGFDFEDLELDFEDLVDEMKGYSSASQSPNDGGTDVWYISEPEVDYRTGEETIYSFHYSRKNHPRYAKYWRKAAAMAGLIK